MAANDKKTTIVIKKITIAAAGGHGGSWKVAFADFMTAMMAFFLVMWLVGQSEEVKKSVADYFSTPSIIEYNFSNFGVELTLEKLFLDLVNEPLKAFEQFIMPADKKPNIMDMGMKKIQVHYLAEKLGEFAKNIEVTSDEIVFEIPEDYLFKKDSARPIGEFPTIMENVRQIVEGLKDVNVYVSSDLPYRDSSQAGRSKDVAEERLDIVMNKVEQAIVDETVDLYGKTAVERINAPDGKRDMRGYIRFRIRQKDQPAVRKMKAEVRETAAQKDVRDDVYDSFVDKLTEKAEGRDKVKPKDHTLQNELPKSDSAGWIEQDPAHE
jgi:chemotaxis protein MotB